MNSLARLLRWFLGRVEWFPFEPTPQAVHPEPFSLPLDDDECPHLRAALHQFPRVRPCTFCPDCGLVLLADGTLTSLGGWFTHEAKEATPSKST